MNRPISQITQCIRQNPTMHHFVTEMCTRVHISVTKWCILGYGTDAFWDLWDGSVVPVWHHRFDVRLSVKHLRIIRARCATLHFVAICCILLQLCVGRLNHYVTGPMRWRSHWAGPARGIEHRSLDKGFYCFWGVIWRSRMARGSLA